MIYTVDEHQLYGRNRDLKGGEVAYLCRLYHKKKCKSRLYMKDGRLYRKDDFVDHNHPSQEFDRSEFAIEKNIKEECGNLDVLVNARSQSSAVATIFEKHMKQYVWEIYTRISIDLNFYVIFFLGRHQSSKLSINKISRNLKKISNGTLPKSPITCEEIIEVYRKESVMANYGMSLQNETDADALPSLEFYKTAYKCKGFSYVVFASQNMVNSIKQIRTNKRKFLMDATFKVCPYGSYSQLLVIHIEHLSEVSIFCVVIFCIKYSNLLAFSWQSLGNLLAFSWLSLGI